MQTLPSSKNELSSSFEHEHLSDGAPFLGAHPFLMVGDVPIHPLDTTPITMGGEAPNPSCSELLLSSSTDLRLSELGPSEL